MKTPLILKYASISATALLSVALCAQELQFEPVQPDVLTAGETLTNAVADYDNDGDLDLFVGFNGSSNKLFKNDGGTFEDVAGAAGVADARATRAAAWGDFDADGDSDLLLGFAPGAGSVLRLYRNDRGRFIDVTSEAGVAAEAGAVRQPAWVDVDGDGDLDLFVAFRDQPDRLYRNQSGKFEDIAPAIGLADRRRTVGAVWFDYDEDGDLDLYAAHQDGDANGLHRNDGGRFTDVADAAGVAWAGRKAGDPTQGSVRPCVADVDGNGRFDLFAANYGPNGLLLNRGAGKFEDVSARWGIALDGRHDTCALADVNNDGRIDLYVNGTVTGGVSYRDYLMTNAGSRFEDVTPPNLLALHASHGALWWDFDSDGDQDLSLAGSRPDPLPLLLRNLAAPGLSRRSISVRVVGPGGKSTRPGAEVRIYAAGTRRLLGARVVDSGSGYNSQSDAPLHFGTGSATRVDVEVIYPSRGQRRVERRSGLRSGASVVIGPGAI